MNSVWPLLLALGVTLGALFGWQAIVIMPLLTLIVTATSQQRAPLLILVSLVGALVGFWRTTHVDAVPLDPSLLAVERVEGTVSSIPQIGPSGPRAVIEVERAVLSGESEWRDETGVLLVFFGDTVPNGIEAGDRLRFRTSIDTLDNLDPGFRRFVQSEGAGGVAWSYQADVVDRSGSSINLLVRFRESVTNRILDAIPGDSGSLIAGFVTGDDSSMSDSARLVFERTNTSHITAVSGGNIAIMVAMWTAFARDGRIRRSVVFQAFLLAIIWSYVIVVGLGPASLRAALFASLMIPASRLGRKPDAMTALMLASAALLIARPEMADSVGFWLSMAASTALVTVSPFGSDRAFGQFHRIILALVAAQLATLPITFWAFGTWSPSSFVANLTIGPMVTLLFPLAYICSGLFLISPVFGSVIGWVPATGASLILATVGSLATAFPMMRSGPVSAIGFVLIGLLCLSVVAVISEDVRRWILRAEFAHRTGHRFVPAALVGAVVGLAVGLFTISIFYE